MGGSILRRIWDTMKPVPPAPQREWEVEPPPVWRRIWGALKPPPPVSVSPETLARRRRLLALGVAVLLIMGLLGGTWGYIKSAPARAETALREGMRLAAAGNTGAAIKHFDRAIAISPNLAAAYLQRGLALQSLHQTAAAIQDLTQALQVDPRLAAAHTAMGLIFQELGNSEKAATELTAALAVQPDEEAYYQRGQIYESLGRHEKAIEDYGAAIRLLPNAPYVYRARATAELNLGDREGASRDRKLAFAIEHPGAENSQ